MALNIILPLIIIYYQRDNCNRNTTSGSMVGQTPRNVDLKPTPTRPIPSQHPGWENETIDACNEKSCRNYCTYEKHYAHGICVAKNVCHCYGHKPVHNQTHGPGWWDHHQPACEQEICSTHCHYNGFPYSICVSNNTCHCYEIVGPPLSKTLEPAEPLQTTMTNNPLTTMSTGPRIPDWEDNPHPSCKKDDCQQYCQQKRYIHAVCWSNASACHCYGNTQNRTNGTGWEDMYDPQCEEEVCHHHCYYNGFTFSICKDNKTCHCYIVVSPKTVEPNKSGQMTTPMEALQTTEPEPHHQWENVSFPICKTDTCFQYCHDKGYSYDVCLSDGHWCHCYGHITNTTHGPGWEDGPQPNCKENRCSRHCNGTGFDHSICVNDKTCHCYKIVYPLTTGPLEPTDSMHTMTSSAPRVPEWENITMSVCKDDTCIHYCKEKGYTYHACLLDERWCHCYGHTGNITHGQGWEDDPQPNCDKDICSRHCSGTGFDHSICVNNKTCHCYKILYPVTANPADPMLSVKAPSVSEWENITVSVCEDNTCIQYCKEKGYSNHACLLDGHWCHCYSHTGNSTQGRGWEDDPQPNCDLDICSRHCSGTGFDYSICVNNKTCHCYKIVYPVTIEPTDPLLTVKPPFSEWENISVSVCKDNTCIQYCKEKGYSNHACLLDGRWCHCYGHGHSTHGQGWEDDPQQNCDGDRCSHHCTEDGYDYSICVNSNTCHCYEIVGPPSSETLKPTGNPQTAQLKQPPDWDNVPTPLCYDAVCLYICEKKQYTRGVCLDEEMCHCYCHKGNSTHGSDWEDDPLQNCGKGDCVYHCNNHGFIQSVCVDNDTCHCYKDGGGRIPHAVNPQTIRPYQQPDWENLTIPLCYDDVCIYYCEKKQYTNGVCLDEQMCHCYGHTNMNSTYNPDWEDGPLLHCRKEGCSNHCSIQGFYHSVCLDCCNCHCYSTRPRSQLRAFKKRLWGDFTVGHCSDCSQFCDVMGHSKGICKDVNTCHCFSCGPETPLPQSGCNDKPLGNCKRESCSSTCQKSGFTQSICRDLNTCHCYDLQLAAATALLPSKMENLNVTAGLCYQASCSYYCRTKGFSIATCTSSSNCLCSSKADGKNTRVELCIRYSCSSFCLMMDYIHGTCTNMKNCYCSGKLTGKNAKRRSLKTFNQKVCFDVLCEIFCRNLGSTEGICIDDKTCKCGRRAQKVKDRPESINNPLEAQTLPTHSRDPLLNKEKDFIEEVCVLALCRNKCKRHNFRKGFCVEGGSRPKCHCYEARRP